MLGIFKASSIECLQNILNEEKRKERERIKSKRKKVRKMTIGGKNVEWMVK